jgi:hypothetical protein
MRLHNVLVWREVATVLCALFCALLLCSGPGLGAQEQQEKPPWLAIGPRVGVTGVVTPQWRFDRQTQEIRSRDSMYFPVYSEIGFNLDERIRLDASGSALIFRQTVLAGGLDQNVLLPSLAGLVGIGTGFGLEALVGPELSLHASTGDPRFVASLAVAVGWVFRVWDRPVPLTLVVVPLSVDWEPRITLLAGIDFPVRIRIPEKKKPAFNY